MKSRGFLQTPQDIMEEYNGCSVPQYTAYPLGQGRTKGANGEVNFSTQVPKVTKNNRMMSRLEQG